MRSINATDTYVCKLKYAVLYVHTKKIVVVTIRESIFQIRKRKEENEVDWQINDSKNISRTKENHCDQKYTKNTWMQIRKQIAEKTQRTLLYDEWIVKCKFPRDCPYCRPQSILQYASRKENQYIAFPRLRASHRYVCCTGKNIEEKQTDNRRIK